MNDIELFLALVAAAVALVWLARVINVPYPALLVVAGLAIGFVPGAPELVLDPDTDPVPDADDDRRDAARTGPDAAMADPAARGRGHPDRRGPAGPGALRHRAAALAYVSQISFANGLSPGVIERARGMYTSRARELAGQCEIGVEAEEGDEAAWANLRRELLAVERQELMRLRDEGRVPNRVLLDVQRDLDLEEARLDSRPFQSPVEVG
jgi:hypothetical protein